jgi:hypothetical protein
MKMRIAIGSLLCGGLFVLGAPTASVAQSISKPGFKIGDNESPRPLDRKAITKKSGAKLLKQKTAGSPGVSWDPTPGAASYGRVKGKTGETTPRTKTKTSFPVGGLNDGLGLPVGPATRN